jgi:hypothetical protein
MPECAHASITPDSRIGELLERWPGLEPVLLELSPHFGALRNPELRRTVARVATLRQVATVSGLPLGVLVEKVRAAAGLPSLAVEAEPGSPAAERPAWAAPSAVARRHDARAAIEAGEHPMPKVMTDLGALGAGEVYELVTPFVPAPLVDIARDRGYSTFSAIEDDGAVRTYFRRSAVAAR